MSRALWLADELRSWDLDVVEVDGWQGRGLDNLDPSVIVCHHTASNQHSGDIPSLPTLILGRPDVDGPLSQIGLARSGKVYIVASGTSNNAGKGSFAGVTGNRHTIGIEAENNGLGEPWPAVQIDAYHRIVAALCSRTGIPVEMVCGHKEWTTRKIDPAGIDMDQFRAAVVQLLAPPPEVPFMALTDAQQTDLLGRVTRIDGELDQVLSLLRTLLGNVEHVEDGQAEAFARVFDKGVKLTEWQREDLERRLKG